MDESTQYMDLIGVYDNSNDPKPIWNQKPAVIGVISSFLALTWICIGLRIYTRLRIIYAPGWDDALVVLFLLSGTSCSVVIMLATNYGLGSHMLELAPETIQVYGTLLYAWNASYCMSAAFIKLSLLFQYLRVFQKSAMRRYVCIPLIVFTSLWGVAWTFMAFFPCLPLNSPNSKCYGFNAPKALTLYRTYLSLAASNMALDVIILLISIPLYFRQGIEKKTKMGLLALLFMGSLSTGFSIARVSTIITTKAGQYPTFDPTWYSSISLILASLEVDIASICASIPVFWPGFTAKLVEIFVTHEIKVETSQRGSVMDHLGYELRDTGGMSPAMSHETLIPHKRSSGGASCLRTKEAHYQDDYIMSQVDPLRPVLGVEYKVTAEKPSRKD